MKLHTAAALLLTACSSSPTPHAAVSEVNLCAIHGANKVADPQHQLQIYGTHVDDLRGFWGEPESKSGNVWHYHWTSLDVDVTLAPEHLCFTKGKPVTPDLWVTEIKAVAGMGKACWVADMADATACPGCVETKDVMKCSP